MSQAYINDVDSMDGTYDPYSGSQIAGSYSTPNSSPTGLWGSFTQGLKDTYYNPETGGLNFSNFASTGLGALKAVTSVMNAINGNKMMKMYKQQQNINNRNMMNNWNAQVDQDYYNKAKAGNGLVGLMGTNATTEVANNIRNGIDNSRLSYIDSKANKTTQPNSVFV